MPSRRYPDPLSRIRANSRPNDEGCWLWMGSVTRNKAKGSEYYGRLTVRAAGKVRRVFAHRYALAASLGVSEGKIRVACHRCNVPLCVNPAHLYNGTPKTNARDRVARQACEA